MRVLIVDDEPSARRKLAEFLRRERDVEISGEAANGMQAAELIDELQPDVVFLDVQMPGMNGFEVLETIHGRIPFVVFVTAYDQYAVKAFEVHAVDYLLKPFDRNRLQACLSPSSSIRYREPGSDQGAAALVSQRLPFDHEGWDRNPDEQEISQESVMQGNN